MPKSRTCCGAIGVSSPKRPNAMSSTSPTNTATHACMPTMVLGRIDPIIGFASTVASAHKKALPSTKVSPNGVAPHVLMPVLGRDRVKASNALTRHASRLKPRTWPDRVGAPPSAVDPGPSGNLMSVNMLQIAGKSLSRSATYYALFAKTVTIESPIRPADQPPVPCR